jgi:hypothetical protein
MGYHSGALGHGVFWTSQYTESYLLFTFFFFHQTGMGGSATKPPAFDGTRNEGRRKLQGVLSYFRGKDYPFERLGTVEAIHTMGANHTTYVRPDHSYLTLFRVGKN